MCTTHLNTGTTGVIQPNDRISKQHRLIHNLHHLLRVSHGQTAPENCEILTENEDGTPSDFPLPRNDAVPRVFLLLHPELCAVVLNKHVIFRERVSVDQ